LINLPEPTAPRAASRNVENERPDPPSKSGRPLRGADRDRGAGHADGEPGTASRCVAPRRATRCRRLSRLGDLPARVPGPPAGGDDPGAVYRALLPGRGPRAGRPPSALRRGPAGG